MDSITINCKISLSKKLRAMLKGPTSFALSGVIDSGRGEGQLTFTSESIDDQINVMEIGQTSIELTPTGIGDEVPGARDSMVGNLFSSAPFKKGSAPESVIRKMAAVHPPERHEVSTAITDRVSTPKAFADLQDQSCRDYIQNIEQLTSAVNKAKATKKSNIDLDNITDPVEKALETERANLEEAIDSPAWVVQDQAKTLVINDLKMEISMNVPCNLGRISAKKIASSRELMGLIRAGILKFIAPDEVVDYVTKAEEIEPGHELPVYSSHEEAEGAIGATASATPTPRTVLIDEANAQDVTENDVGEEEGMVINLTRNVMTRPMPTETAVPRSRVSRHGQVSPTQSDRPKPAIRTIARKE